MKRRDWKTKKLKKGFFGKYYKKSARLIFLRNLSVRKIKFMHKKHLVTNYTLYGDLLKKFDTKYNHVSNLYFYNNSHNNFYFLFNTFFFRKKIFSLLTQFKDWVFNSKLNYIFINKNKNYCKDLLVNNNVIVFNENNVGVDLNLLENEENFKIFTFKSDLLSNNFYKLDKTQIDKNLNFFFNYNVYSLNLVEIYKILLILYINKLK